jgi:hypothetical protein
VNGLRFETVPLRQGRRRQSSFPAALASLGKALSTMVTPAG